MTKVKGASAEESRWRQSPSRRAAGSRRIGDNATGRRPWDSNRGSDVEPLSDGKADAQRERELTPDWVKLMCGQRQWDLFQARHTFKPLWPAYRGWALSPLKTKPLQNDFNVFQFERWRLPRALIHGSQHPCHPASHSRA